MTQEELAEKLFVSRTAISKWESGRGYPSIDSLKAIAKFFHVTIDELICGDEMAALAEEDIKSSRKKTSVLVCGVLDCMTILLFFLPVFGNGGGESISSVSLLNITNAALWLKILFIVTVSLTVLNGFSTVVLVHFDRPEWNKHRSITGIVLSVFCTLLFILARQPYAGAFCLCLLVIKGVLMLKSK